MGRGRHNQGQGAGSALRDSPALDDLLLMRKALAYEARVIEVHLEGYARVPKALHEMAATSAENLRRAARGDGEAVYLHGYISGPAAESLTSAVEAADDPLAITACTDAENTLRLALAYEASQVDRMLEFSGFPQSRRRIAAERAAAMRLAAVGHPGRAYAGQNARSFAGPLADLETGSTTS